MSDKIDSLGDLRMSPQAEAGRSMAPPPRRKSFSKLRRRLSQTFRFSFNGSLSEFSTAWPGGEDGGGDRANGHQVSSRLRTISTLTRKLSLSNPRILVPGSNERESPLGLTIPPFGVVHEHP